MEKLKFDAGSLRRLIMILLGNALYALAVCMFIEPNGLITGGSTGISLFVHRMTGCPVSAFAAAFNGIMFVIGWAVLGRRFALTTALSTAFFPIVLGVYERFPALAVHTDTPMLAVAYAGLMIGAGIGLVIRAGASTGGMDIPPLILKKKFNISVSVSLYAFDFVILLMQCGSTDIQNVLYGILMMMIYTVVLDQMLLVGMARMKIEIVSAKHEEINRCLTDELDCGTTLMRARTGFFGNDCMLVMSVVNARELPRVNARVLEIDPEAFIVVGRINEVKGRGYTLDRVHELRRRPE